MTTQTNRPPPQSTVQYSSYCPIKNYCCCGGIRLLFPCAACSKIFYLLFILAFFLPFLALFILNLFCFVFFWSVLCFPVVFVQSRRTPPRKNYYSTSRDHGICVSHQEEMIRWQNWVAIWEQIPICARHYKTSVRCNHGHNHGHTFRIVVSKVSVTRPRDITSFFTYYPIYIY